MAGEKHPLWQRRSCGQTSNGRDCATELHTDDQIEHFPNRYFKRVHPKNNAAGHSFGQRGIYVKSRFLKLGRNVSVSKHYTLCQSALRCSNCITGTLSISCRLRHKVPIQFVRQESFRIERTPRKLPRRLFRFATPPNIRGNCYGPHC